MIDHLSITAHDFDTMAEYYARVLGVLGYRKGVEFTSTLQLTNAASGESIWIAAAGPGAETDPIHIAWHADSVDEVHAFYREALKGGKDNGAPGPRDYEPGYYACFVFDPEGNNIEAVFRGYRG